MDLINKEEFLNLTRFELYGGGWAKVWDTYVYFKPLWPDIKKMGLKKDSELIKTILERHDVSYFQARLAVQIFK